MPDAEAVVAELRAANLEHRPTRDVGIEASPVRVRYLPGSPAARRSSKRAYNRSYYEAHADELRAYRQTNQPRETARKRQRYAEDPGFKEATKERRRAWYARMRQDPERLALWQAKKRADSAKRRAQRKARPEL